MKTLSEKILELPDGGQLLKLADAWREKHYRRDTTPYLSPRNLDDYLDRLTGREIYDWITMAVGGGPRAASEWLDAHGVKGITYDGHYDGRCFVIFDDQAITMLDARSHATGAAALATDDPLDDEVLDEQCGTMGNEPQGAAKAATLKRAEETQQDMGR